MKEFKPSGNFVVKVMHEVRMFEAANKPVASRSQLVLSTPLVRYALSVGGALLGIINLIRIYSTVFSPVICR